MDNGFNGFNDAQQDDLQRLLREINRIQVNTRNRATNSNTRTRRTTEHADTIALLRELLYLYNTNMREYQENMRLMLQTIYLLVSQTNIQQTNRTNPVNERRNETDYLYYSIFPYLNRTTTPINTFNENVIVRPSSEQIETGTINYNFSIDDSINNTNTNCPITLEEFQQGEAVCKIRHCGHTFRRDAINNWFQGNVRCPVCRYDIREYTANSVPPQQTNPLAPNNQSLTDEELQNNLRDRISNSLMNIINQYYDEADLSQNLTYTFEFPILYNDISANYTRLR